MKKRIVLHNNWRARQLGLPADLTVEQWIDVLEQSNGYCFHCHFFIGEEVLVLDHLVPLALGGGTTLNNGDKTRDGKSWLVLRKDRERKKG